MLGGGDNRRQRFCNNINDMMHLLGHLFHNLSDLHINIRDRPPRQMHTMNSMQHSTSAVISAAVPIEANIQIPFPAAPTNLTNLRERIREEERQRRSHSLSSGSHSPAASARTTQVPAAAPPPASVPEPPAPAANAANPAESPAEATDLPIPLPFATESTNERRSRNQSADANLRNLPHVPRSATTTTNTVPPPQIPAPFQIPQIAPGRTAFRGQNFSGVGML